MSEIRIEPWAEGDLPLLEKLLGDPAMTEHLGGPEPLKKIAERQERYEQPDGCRGRAAMFKIVDGESGEGVGSVGYWERELPEMTVYETGWSVLPAFQGRGIATVATAQCIEQAAAQRKHKYLHAYPGVENLASNAICRKLGFELLGAFEFEYPKDSGNIMSCNDWRLDLFAEN